MLRTIALLTLTVMAAGPGFPERVQAEDDAPSIKYKVMFRLGLTGEWREATDAGSPAKTKDAADRIAAQIKGQYGGGLASIETDVREEASVPAVVKLAGTKWVVKMNRSISFTYDDDGYAYYFNSSEADAKLARSRYKWKQNGATVEMKYNDPGSLTPPNKRGKVSGGEMTMYYYTSDWMLYERYKDQPLILVLSSN